MVYTDFAFLVLEFLCSTKKKQLFSKFVIPSPTILHSLVSVACFSKPKQFFNNLDTQLEINPC